MPVPNAPTLDDTVLRGAAPRQTEAAAAAEPATRSRGWLRWVGIAAVAVVMAGVGVAALNAGGTPEPEARPPQDQDAVPTTVPAPTELTIARNTPTTATASWTVAEAGAQAGDRYLWERFGPGASGERGTVEEPSAAFTDLAEDDPLCLRVWLLRANGQRSADPAENCEE